MLFNSPEFLVFFALVYGLYLLLPFRPQNLMLLLASYIFYGWWDARFLFLVVLSTVVDFWVGLLLANDQLTIRQRILPAAYLVFSAVIFLGFNFNNLNLYGFDRISLQGIVQFDALLTALFGVLVYLSFLSLLYYSLQRSTSSKKRLLYLMISLVTQLGLLGIFKYFNFFADNLASALSDAGIEANRLHLNIILPVGVSFYTFQSLSYTIDIYRKQFKPTDRFFDFALFVAFFPQLQAGPIERGRQLIPQLSRPRSVNIDQLSRGAYLIVLGFFKKVAIADGVAPIVDQIFSSTGRVSFIDVVVGTVLFAVQIYCDFSGYTDIARGISKLMGIEMMVNFEHPYFATNPQDFWRRWHISLSTWLRDYLFIPLGGSRGNLIICVQKFDDYYVARRSMAWRRMEFRVVGLLSGRSPLRISYLDRTSIYSQPPAMAPANLDMAAQNAPCHGKSHFLFVRLLWLAAVSRAFLLSNFSFFVTLG